MFCANRTATAQTPAGSNAPLSPPSLTLFQNVRIFDGKKGELSPPSSVLIRGNKIERISQTPISVEGAGGERTTIDGGGRTLMPGLIDAHFHTMAAGIPVNFARYGDVGYLNLLASKQAASCSCAASPPSATPAAPHSP